MPETQVDIYQSAEIDTSDHTPKSWYGLDEAETIVKLEQLQDTFENTLHTAQRIPLAVETAQKDGKIFSRDELLSAGYQCFTSYQYCNSLRKEMSDGGEYLFNKMGPHRAINFQIEGPMQNASVVLPHFEPSQVDLNKSTIQELVALASSIRDKLALINKLKLGLHESHIQEEAIQTPDQLIYEAKHAFVKKYGSEEVISNLILQLEHIEDYLLIRFAHDGYLPACVTKEDVPEIITQRQKSEEPKTLIEAPQSHDQSNVSPNEVDPNFIPTYIEGSFLHNVSEELKSALIEANLWDLLITELAEVVNQRGESINKLPQIDIEQFIIYGARQGNVSRRVIFHLNRLGMPEGHICLELIEGEIEGSNSVSITSTKMIYVTPNNIGKYINAFGAINSEAGKQIEYPRVQKIVIGQPRIRENELLVDWKSLQAYFGEASKIMSLTPEFIEIRAKLSAREKATIICKPNITNTGIQLVVSKYKTKASKKDRSSGSAPATLGKYTKRPRLCDLSALTPLVQPSIHPISDPRISLITKFFSGKTAEVLPAMSIEEIERLFPQLYADITKLMEGIHVGSIGSPLSSKPQLEIRVAGVQDKPGGSIYQLLFEIGCKSPSQSFQKA